MSPIRGDRSLCGTCKTFSTRLLHDKSLLLKCRAEVFVLIIMSSLPTLKPLFSLIQGCMPSMGSNTFSKKQRTKGSKITTVGSKSSNGFHHRGQGDITIALNEIDNLSRQQAGSSTELILASSKENTTAQTATASQASGSPRNSLPPSPKIKPCDAPAALIRNLSSSLRKDRLPRDTSAERAIQVQVQRDFVIGYDKHSEQDTIALERSKRP